jgi:hypothetical protein
LRAVKRFLKALGIALAALLALFALAWGIGTRVPLAHSASVTVEIARPPEAVWRLVRDIEGSAGWRPNVEKVERLPDRDGRPVFREWTDFGPLDYALEADEPPRRMVTRVLDHPDFGGTWTWTIEPHAAGSTLTIREDGEIQSPLFRFLARYVLGYDSTLRSYASALEAELASA